MKTLLILRHAKSDWNNSRMSDYERPLNKRGQQDAPRMGLLLRHEDLTPDLIIASSAERARITAELVAEACGYEGDIIYTRHFYLAAPDAYMETLREMGKEQERIMVVGHNPGMEYLVELLTEEREVMGTAVLAQVNLPIAEWADLDDETMGELVNVWRPKEV